MDWVAYSYVEPFGPVESVISSVMEGVSGKKGVSPAKKQSPGDMKKIFNTIFFGTESGKKLVKKT